MCIEEVGLELAEEEEKKKKKTPTLLYILNERGGDTQRDSGESENRKVTWRKINTF